LWSYHHQEFIRAHLISFIPASKEIMQYLRTSLTLERSMKETQLKLSCKTEVELQTSNTNVLQYWGRTINFEYKCLARVGWNYELRIQMSWETGVELQNFNTNPKYLSINFKQNIIIITWHCHWWSSRVST